MGAMRCVEEIAEIGETHQPHRSTSRQNGYDLAGRALEEHRPTR